MSGMLGLLVLFVVLVAGAAYLLSRKPRGTAQAGGATDATAWAALGAGIAAVALTALAAAVSFTTVFEATPLNGPLAFAAFLGLPAALLGLVCGAFGLRSARRVPAAIGIVLSIMAIASWTYMETLVG